MYFSLFGISKVRSQVCELVLAHHLKATGPSQYVRTLKLFPLGVCRS